MKQGYLPRQHGAWAMLIIPFLFGMFAAGPAPVHALLFAGWLLAYLFSYAGLQWIRTRKERFRKPACLYGGLLAPIGAALMVWRPALAIYALPYLPLLAVNAYYARRNRERAFVNDLIAVVQFSLMTFVAYTAGGGDDWRVPAELFALSVAYFTGTIFYVKTMIREKHSIHYYRASVGYHLVLLAAGAVWSPVLAVPFAVLLVRAVWSPRAKLTVKQTGILEIVYSVLFAGTVLLFVL
mgnify:CR=1 FL=1|jgi:hypothetical protein